MYIDISVDVHQHHMSHRLQIAISDSQYVFLHEEAERSSVSIAELIRRAIDTTYDLAQQGRVREIVHTLGRRPGRPIVD
jgi:hypothetical protein